MPRSTILDSAKRKFIEENIQLNVLEKYHQWYLEVILQNLYIISPNKFDLGQTNTLLHKITLKTAEYVYVKHFKISDPHCKQVEKHIAEWLKLGII